MYQVVAEIGRKCYLLIIKIIVGSYSRCPSGEWTGRVACANLSWCRALPGKRHRGITKRWVADLAEP